MLLLSNQGYIANHLNAVLEASRHTLASVESSCQSQAQYLTELSVKMVKSHEDLS